MTPTIKSVLTGFMKLIVYIVYFQCSGIVSVLGGITESDSSHYTHTHTHTHSV